MEDLKNNMDFHWVLVVKRKGREEMSWFGHWIRKVWAHGWKFKARLIKFHVIRRRPS